VLVAIVSSRWATDRIGLAVNFVVMRFDKDDDHLHQRIAKYVSVRIVMTLDAIRGF
jgi:hypothetical protein